MNSKNNLDLVLEEFMEKAIAEAYKGIGDMQSPFGALAYSSSLNKLVGSSHNTVLKDNDPTAHAEINLIRKLGKKFGSINFSNLDLIVFSTCEPCPMCFSALHWSGVNKVVFGAFIEDAKEIGFNEILIKNEEMIKFSKGSIKISSKGGVLRDKCIEMMKEWKNKVNIPY